MIQLVLGSQDFPYILTNFVLLVRRGIKFEELCAGIQKANVATPTAPFPRTPTEIMAVMAAAAATPRNSNTTDEPSASLPQDEVSQ